MASMHARSFVVTDDQSKMSLMVTHARDYAAREARLVTREICARVKINRVARSDDHQAQYPARTGFY